MIKAMSGLAGKHLATMPPGLDKHESLESRTQPHVVKNQNQSQKNTLHISLMIGNNNIYQESETLHDSEYIHV